MPNDHFIHQVNRMRVIWADDLLGKVTQQSADDSSWASKDLAHMLPFHTSYLFISHTAVVLCVCKRDR